MKKAIVASFAVAAVFAVTAPVNAASVSALGPGVLDNNYGASQATFDSIAVQTPFDTSSHPDFSDNGALFSGPKIVMQNDGGDPGGFYAEPFNDHTNYLAVVPNPTGTTTNVALGGTFLRLGLYWGSIDTYNTIEFYRTGHVGAIDSVTGQDAANAVPGAANGCQQSNLCNAYIIISAIGDGLGFDSFKLISTSNSFEVDNVAWDLRTGGGPSTTPLPAALPLFLSGLGGLGFFGFWRKKKRALKMAAA